jgi:hypothetical protein
MKAMGSLYNVYGTLLQTMADYGVSMIVLSADYM